MVCSRFNEKDLSIFEEPICFKFCISNLDNSAFYISIKNQTVEPEEKMDTAPDLVITLSDKNLLKIIKGKLMPVVAYATRRLGIQGDMTLH